MSSPCEYQTSQRPTDGLITVAQEGDVLQRWINALPFTFPGDTEPTLLAIQEMHGHTVALSMTYELRDPNTGTLYFAKRYWIPENSRKDKALHRRMRKASLREMEIGRMLYCQQGIVPPLGYITNNQAPTRNL